jgi:gamma-glutamyltranspeptidase/glutathione hydrolase
MRGAQGQMLHCAREAVGYRIRRRHLTYAFAGVHGIIMLEGGADPQRDGYAAGVV